MAPTTKELECLIALALLKPKSVHGDFELQ